MAPKNKKAAAKKKNEKKIKQKTAQSAKEALERKKNAENGGNNLTKTAEKSSAVKNIGKTAVSKEEKKKEKQRLKDKKAKEKREMKQEKRREKLKKAKEKQKAAETADKKKKASPPPKPEKDKKQKQDKKKQSPEKAPEPEKQKEKTVKEKPVKDKSNADRMITTAAKIKSTPVNEPAAKRVITNDEAEKPAPEPEESLKELEKPCEELAEEIAEEYSKSDETVDPLEPEIEEISEYAEISESGESVEETETEDINDQEPAAELPDELADYSAEEEPFAPDAQEATEEPEIDEISEYAEIAEAVESLEETETENINKREPAAELPDEFADYSAEEERFAPDKEDAAKEQEIDEIFEYTETPEPDEYCEAAKPESVWEPRLIPVSEESEEVAIETVEPTEETDVWRALASAEETEKIIMEVSSEEAVAPKQPENPNSGENKNQEGEKIIKAFSGLIYKTFALKSRIKAVKLSEKTKKIILWTSVAAVAAACLIIAAPLLSLRVPDVAMPVYAGLTEGTGNVRDIELGMDSQLEKVEATKTKGDKKAFKIYANDNAVIDEWYDRIPLLFGNIDSNKCDIIISILDKDDNIVYRSMGIPPGYTMPSVKLFDSMPYGEYDLRVFIAAYDPKTFENIGVQLMKLKLVIGIEQETQQSTEQTTQ